MAPQDLANNIDARPAFGAAVGTDTTTAGAIIDTLGFGSTTFLASLSARTDGTYTPLIEEGDEADLSDAAAVDDQHLIGTEADAALDATGVVKRIGYAGFRRYVRLSFVSTDTTTGATPHATAVLGHPHRAPVA